MNKRIYLALIAFTPLISHASTFNGPYIGVDAGPAWGSSSYHTNPGCPPGAVDAVFCNSSPSSSSVNGTAVANSGSGTFNPRGANYGIYAGYNFDRNGVVYGGEADFGGLNLNASTTATGTFPFPFLGTTYSLYDSISTNWLGTLRGRIGLMPQSRLLIFATGGLAFTQLKVSSSYNDNAIGGGLLGGSGSASNSWFQSGWTAGVGAEWELSQMYALKVEYLYMKFGSTNVSMPVSNSPAFNQTMQMNANLDAQVLRVGLSYNI